MNESQNLNDQTRFRLNEINRIKDYFYSEIQERKTMSKKLSKYIAAFDYASKIFIAICNIWYLKCRISCNNCWNSCCTSKCFFDCRVFCNNGDSKEIIKRDKEKKKKHNNIVILAKSKLNSIETLMS